MIVNTEDWIETIASEVIRNLPDDSAATVAEALEALGAEGDQDWDACATTWHFPDGSKIIIDGPVVTVY